MSDAPNFAELTPTPAPVDDVGPVALSPELQAVYDVPVRVQAVLGRAVMPVSSLLQLLQPGQVIDLDRRVGESIDIYVNDRLVARGEVVLVDDNLGVTMTEIIKDDRSGR